MKHQFEPEIVKDSQVAEMLNIGYSKFSSEKFQELLEKKNFPKRIPDLGYGVRDIRDWLDSINPNRSKRITDRHNWDTV